MKKDEFELAVERLQHPFALRDIDWVPNFTYPKDGEKTYENTVIGVAPYIRREAVVTRFNVVCGPGEWENFLDPLGKFGLYQGIAINLEGEWVRKWDGAQLDEGGRIDAVKGGVSRSIRRAGEMWGVGLYLQFIPKLFAVKRPSDDYQAAEKWSSQGVNFTIRWDYPTIPKEFMPDYMTPEQYVRMKRIVKYFSEAKQKTAKEIISDWENDHTSVTYEDAEMTIGLIEDQILDRLNAMDNRRVTARPEKHGQKPTPATNDRPKKKGANQSEQPPAQPQAGPPAPQGNEEVIDVVSWANLVDRVKFIEGLDPAAQWHERDWLEGIKKRVNQHKQKKKLITKPEYEGWIQAIESIELQADDDELPF